MMRLAKLIFIFLIGLVATPAIGQTKFDASEITNALDTIAKVKTGRTTKWAENIARLGNLDEKSNIRWKLNIIPSDTLYYGSVADCVLKFVKKYNPYLAINYKKSSPEHIVIRTIVPRILFSDGTVSLAMSIDAHGEMDIDITPKCITMTMMVKKYVNADPYGVSKESNEVVWMAVGDVSPFKNRSEKKFWSRAFINSNVTCITLAKNFASFLSENYKGGN